jgi:hypothetical protein
LLVDGGECEECKNMAFFRAFWGVFPLGPHASQKLSKLVIALHFYLLLNAIANAIAPERIVVGYERITLHTARCRLSVGMLACLARQRKHTNGCLRYAS